MAKLPVLDKTAWINRGNRPEKVTARGVRISQSKAGSIGGKGIHMTAPGMTALMKAPQPFRATDLHLENARKVKLAVRAPRKRAAAEESVRVWRAAGAVPMAKKSKPVDAPKPRLCEQCGVVFPSKKACGRHYNEAHFVERVAQ